jgi:DNA-directed RNA polymerase specialized sigma24 family protein
MWDQDAPSSKRVLALLADRRTRSRLVQIAVTITGSWADADDLVSDAINRVLDPDDSPWVKGAFMTHMAYVLKQTWQRQQRIGRHHREKPDEDATRDKKSTSREHPADEQLEGHRSLALRGHLGELLLADIDDPLVRKCFELSLRGVEPTEQAAILGCTVREIYDMRHLIRRRARRVLEEWENAEEKRMKELRSKFRLLKPEGGEEPS